MASTASIGKHPIHPMLVPFPVGLWIFSLVSDIIALAGGDPVWARVAWYSMAGGVIGAVLAAIPGFVDLITMESVQTRHIGILHAILNVSALVLFVVDFFLRLSLPPGNIGPFILSIVGVCLILVSGWLGGEMVYIHGAAVEPQARIEGPRREDWKKAA